jgi:hypothetical protein
MSNPDWKTLPAFLRDDPAIISLRLISLEDWRQSMEKEPVPTENMVDTPVGKVSAKLIAVCFLLVLLLHPEIISNLLTKR